MNQVHYVIDCLPLAETSGSESADEHGGAIDDGEGPEKMTGSEQNTNSKVLEKVGKVIVSMNEANNADLTSPSAFSVYIITHLQEFAGSIDKQYRDELAFNH